MNRNKTPYNTSRSVITGKIRRFRLKSTRSKYSIVNNLHSLCLLDGLE